MGALGGLFLVLLLLLGFMFCGFFFIADEVRNRISRKHHSKTHEEQLDLLFKALTREGFFNSTDAPKYLTNKALSEVISDASKIEGFFWGVCKRGIRIVDNPEPQQHDRLLVFENNIIGFNWRGRA